MTTIKAEKITSFINARPIKEFGLARLKGKIEVLGYLANFPLTIAPCIEGKDGFTLDGRHRFTVGTDLGIDEFPCQQVEGDRDFLLSYALKSNEASETVVPTFFTDQAELIWRLAEEGKTQEHISKILGWSRGNVSNYIALSNVHREAWFSIATSIEKDVASQNGDGVAGVATSVAFTEGLLRSILHLTPDQQIELVSELATNKDFKKSKFKDMAENYRARNEACEHFLLNFGYMGDEYISQAQDSIDQGYYDKEWKDNKGPGEKFNQLCQSLKDAYEEKNSIRLIHGDFNSVVKTIQDSSVDAIITDPPYNISTDRVFDFAGRRTDISKNFGEWDCKPKEEFVKGIAFWANQFFRIMKEGTTGFMFVGYPLLNVTEAIFQQAGFETRQPFFWCRSNPGASVTKADFMPAMDYAIQFSKPGKTRIFNYPDDPEGYNYRIFPICGGNERIKNSKGETLHPTQKPEAVIKHLMEIITIPGSLVFDGFMGVGTVPAVAKKMKRKAIGIELDKEYYTAACKRVE